MRILNDVEESKLYFGDNLTVMDELPAYAFSLILTDPPYLFDKHNGKEEAPADGRKKLNSSALYDYSDDSGMCRIKNGLGKEAVFRWLNMTPRLMRKYNAYIFCSEAQIGIYQQWAYEHGYKCGILVWEKPATIISKQRWCQNVEFIVRIYENGTALNKFDDSSLYSRVLRYKTLRKKHHPTEKPLAMFQHLIRMNTQEGDAVLDPFLGSGTTYIAASTLGRKCVGIENNHMFYEVARKRIAEETGEGLLL